MRYHLHTSININANRETVWNTFTNFDSYSEWDTFIKSIKGELKVGHTIEAEITNMTFRPTVKVWEPQQELTWLGKMKIPFVFDGRHTFRFTENADGTTTFVHEENFRGILVPLMKKKLRTEIREGFLHFNETLKKHAEK